MICFLYMYKVNTHLVFAHLYIHFINRRRPHSYVHIIANVYTQLNRTKKNGTPRNKTIYLIVT